MNHTHYRVMAVFVLASLACTLLFNLQVRPEPEYQIHRSIPTPEAESLTATVNVSPVDGKLDANAWIEAGWRISNELAPNPLDLDCTLYRIPGTHPQQWLGRCWGNIEAILALPQDVLSIVVQNPRGEIVRLYSIP